MISFLPVHSGLTHRKKSLISGVFTNALIVSVAGIFQYFLRLPVSKFKSSFYEPFINNDADTVLYFSHDQATLRKNNAELSGKPEFNISEKWSGTRKKSSLG